MWQKCHLSMTELYNFIINVCSIYAHFTLSTFCFSKNLGWSVLLFLRLPEWCLTSIFLLEVTNLILYLFLPGFAIEIQLITCAWLFTEFPIHIFIQQPITYSGGLWPSVYYSEYKFSLIDILINNITPVQDPLLCYKSQFSYHGNIFISELKVNKKNMHPCMCDMNASSSVVSQHR